MKTITFSRNIFLPLTNVCANACGYCSFKAPVKDGCVMNRAEVEATIKRGSEFKCTEALFTYGERPELQHGFEKFVKAQGFDTILDYSYEMSKFAIKCGILPHTNAGIMTYEEMETMRTVNASLGLMLETTAQVEAHRHSPGKDPAVRIEMIENAGKLSIPFTTGLLLGIGEKREDRIESLETIRDLHKRYGHIQEIIIQNFCPKEGTEMENCKGADYETIRETIELAHDILPDDIAVQIPPNLTNASSLLKYGVNDLGGVSPVTIDYINPEHPWPELDVLKEITKGFELRERLCIYEKYCSRKWVDESILPLVNRLSERIYH